MHNREKEEEISDQILERYDLGETEARKTLFGLENGLEISRETQDATVSSEGPLRDQSRTTIISSFSVREKIPIRNRIVKTPKGIR